MHPACGGLISWLRYSASPFPLLTGSSLLGIRKRPSFFCCFSSLSHLFFFIKTHYSLDVFAAMPLVSYLYHSLRFHFCHPSQLNPWYCLFWNMPRYWCSIRECYLPNSLIPYYFSVASWIPIMLLTSSLLLPLNALIFHHLHKFESAQLWCPQDN